MAIGYKSYVFVLVLKLHEFFRLAFTERVLCQYWRH